jgi:serine/threonine-protein kinase HipA
MRLKSYCDKRLFPFFEGLVPEGWLLDIASLKLENKS